MSEIRSRPMNEYTARLVYGVADFLDWLSGTNNATNAVVEFVMRTDVIPYRLQKLEEYKGSPLTTEEIFSYALEEERMNRALKARSEIKTALYKYQESSKID